MRKSVFPSEIAGTVAAPASKSVTQRALAAALLADEAVVLLHPSRCDDALAAAGVIQALGATVAWGDDRIVVQGGRGIQKYELDCGESGLCIRIFTPIAALYASEIRLTGGGSLVRRPMSSIERPLRELGAFCSSRDGFLPLTVKGPLRGGRTVVDGSMGSQFLTGLLMALPKAETDSELAVERPTSIPYIELTLQVLERFGVSITHRDYRNFKIKSGQAYRRTDFVVEGDWSGAAFLLAAGALAGSVRVKGLDRDSLQGDRKILEVLEMAGAAVRADAEGIEVSRALLRPFDFDITHCPDLAPPLVALATGARGESVIRGTERLVHKESNRAEALVGEFRALGADIRAEEGRIVVAGGRLRGGSANARGDHRMAMAVAAAALAAEGPVSIEGAECVNKSYPAFFEDLRTLGGHIHE